MDPANATWRKSSYSGNEGNCVEVGHATGRLVVRDTKDQGRGPVLNVSPADWSQFKASICR
jgi:hypothetical protein